MPRPNKSALTDTQKLRIVGLFTRKEATQGQLAERFGVTPRCISQVTIEWLNSSC